MLDIGWTEFALIAVIALLVIGPKDLPHLIRSFGRWSGKARKYARDFQRNFEDMAEESEMAAVRRELEEANRELTAARQFGAEPSAQPGADAKAAGKGNGAAASGTAGAPELPPPARAEAARPAASESQPKAASGAGPRADNRP